MVNFKKENAYLDDELKGLAKSQEYSSKAIKGKIDARIDHNMLLSNGLIELRKTIKDYSLSFEEICCKIATIAGALRNFISCKQKGVKSLLDCTCRFKVG